MNDMQRLENLRKNIEIERERLGYSQSQMAEAIGISLSSYRRMIAGEMNLRASIVIKNLYYLTGKCCWEFMEENTPELIAAKKLRQLNKEQMQIINNLMDYFLNN